MKHNGDLVDLRRDDGAIMRLPIALLCELDQTHVMQGDDSIYEIDGVGRIRSPTGYRWQFGKEMDTPAGKALVYLCTAPSKTGGRMTLTVSPQVAIGDGVRSAHLKGHWNGIVEMFPAMGIEVTRATKPVVSGTIPDRVEYQATGLSSEQVPILIRGVTLFGEAKTYLFQIIETDNAQPTKLYSISKSFIPFDSE